MSQKTSPFDRLTERMKRYSSIERLLLMRNLGYGGAATCLVVLLSLTQVRANAIALKISAFSAAVALPMWLLLGAIYEIYIFLGKGSYGHLRTKSAANYIGLTSFVAGLGSFGAAGGVVWFLDPQAFYAFAATSVIATFVGIRFHIVIAQWWFSTDGPGGRDGEQLQ